MENNPPPTEPAPPLCNLRAIRDRVNAVEEDDMPLPFRVEVAGVNYRRVVDNEGQHVASDMEDALTTLLAHAPSDLLALCDEVQRYRDASGKADPS